MKHTKERILETALELFSEKGYAAASMSEIASRLNITKGALYRHFASKRAIMEGIISRMEEQDRQQAQDSDVPANELSISDVEYGKTSLASIRAFTLQMFSYWTEDSFASAFRRLIALERFHDVEMMFLYQNYLCAGPLGYMEDLFREMSAQGHWEEQEAPELALEYFGPMLLMMEISDTAADKTLAKAKLEEYIDRFIQKYEPGKGETNDIQ